MCSVCKVIKSMCYEFLVDIKSMCYEFLVDIKSMCSSVLVDKVIKS